MDKLLSGLAALIGGVALLSRTGLSVPQLVTSEIGIFLIGFLGIKLARALSWPYYFSDLRNLPGPKVTISPPLLPSQGTPQLTRETLAPHSGRPVSRRPGASPLTHAGPQRPVRRLDAAVAGGAVHPVCGLLRLGGAAGEQCGGAQGGAADEGVLVRQAGLLREAGRRDHREGSAFQRRRGT